MNLTALLHYYHSRSIIHWSLELESVSHSNVNFAKSLSEKTKKQTGWIPAMFFMYTVDETALALFVFRTGLTRQWHAGGGIRAGGVFFDLILSNRKSSWAERRPPGANRRRCRERTGLVSACWIHVSWNSYCTPGGNVLKRSSRLKKRHTHVFCGLQGNWKSHAALPDYYREARLCFNGDGQSSKIVILSRITRVICNGLLV